VTSALAKVGLPELENLDAVTEDRLRELLATCRQAILTLAIENDQLRRKLLGPKSERVSRDEIAGQLLLFAEWAKDALGEDDPEAAADEPLAPELAAELAADAAAAEAKPAKRKPRRVHLPDDLPTRTITHVVPDAERRCPECGNEQLESIGVEASERLEWVPGHFERIKIEREKLACTCRRYVCTAPLPPQPVPKGIPGPNLLAKVVVDKYLKHLPLYRQAMTFLLEHGVVIPVATMCGWVHSVADLLDLVYRVMVADVLRSQVIHTDDTSVRVQAQHSESETGKVRLWPYIGDEDHPHVVFDYTTSRKRDGPAAFLAGFKGYLQADAYIAYDGIFAGGEVHEVACWAHARRYFYEARDHDPKRSAVVLALIQDLFKIEERGKRVSPEARLALRRREAAPVLKRLSKVLDAFALEVLPKGGIGRGITYVTNQWAALVQYLERPDLSISNNAAERQVRPVAVGRKNWLTIGSDAAGHSAAVIYSILASCVRIGANPMEYLVDVLRRAPAVPAELAWELTPFAWKAAREAAPVAARPANTDAPQAAVASASTST